MANITSDSDLQNKLTTLRRAPCPKPPIAEPTSQPEFLKNLKKLRPVSNPDTCKNTNEEAASINNNENNNVGRKKSVKEKAKMLNQKDNKGGSSNKPLLPSKPQTTPKPHPVNGFKPAVTKPPPNKEDAFKSPQRTHSIISDKPSPEIQPGYEDKRVPELSPLPPVSSLGDPPKKPKKLWPLKKSLEKYIGTSHPPLPNIITKPTSNLEDVKRKPAMSLPTDAPPIPSKPVKTDINLSHNQEKVEEKPATVTTDATDEDSEGEDFYDDTTGMDISTGTRDDTFGEDIYEPVTTMEDEENTVETVEEENYEVLPAENESVPPALPPHTEKITKEDKKKKEREEKERRKRDKEEKEKDEKERKKRGKDKERKVYEMKRRFSVRGNEATLGTCIAVVDIQGNKMDISATIGEEFHIIRKDKTPTNKWLVRNKQDQYGFLDISNIEKDSVGGEDIYEEVSVVKESMQSFNEDDIPAPPMVSPPPPPKSTYPVIQEIYDDVTAGEGEELYELLDN